MGIYCLESNVYLMHVFTGTRFRSAKFETLCTRQAPPVPDPVTPALSGPVIPAPPEPMAVTPVVPGSVTQIPPPEQMDVPPRPGPVLFAGPVIMKGVPPKS